MRWSLEHFGLALGSTKEHLQKSIFELKVSKEIASESLEEHIKELLKSHKLSGTATEGTLANKTVTSFYGSRFLESSAFLKSLKHSTG